MMFELDRIIRDNIKQLRPYSSARDEYAGKEGVFLDANENPYGECNRYPDPYQRTLKAEIADWRKVKREQVFVGNGSDEIIDLLMRITCQPREHKALVMPPTYGIYTVTAAINEVEVVNCPLNEHFQMDMNALDAHLGDSSIRLLFICTPNNPTGNCIDWQDITQVLDRFKGLVVIDEAYVDFSGQRSWTHCIDEYPNMVVLQTFSKAWGLAGARVGMAYAQEGLIGYLNKVKPAYNVSTLNQKEALNKLKDRPTYLAEIDHILNEKNLLIEELKELSLIKRVYPSDSNFILVEVDNADSVYNSLTDQRIIVRNRNSIISSCLRISIGSSEENERLISALKKITS